MAVTVLIPTPLRGLTGGAEEVTAEGSDVGAVIDDLERRYPGIKARICDETGKVRRFVNLFVDDEDIRFLDDLGTPVSEGSSISIIPAIAGGSRAGDAVPPGWPVPSRDSHDPRTSSRYGRQRLLPEVGEAGQERLSRARVRVEGDLDIAATAATYLHRAGLGEVGPTVSHPDVSVRCTTRPGAARVEVSDGRVEAESAPGPDAVFVAALAAVEAIKLVLPLGRRATVEVSPDTFDFRAGRLP